MLTRLGSLPCTSSNHIYEVDMNRRTNTFPLPHQQPNDTRAALLVGIAALGYFVDVFDLVLFNVVRTGSLRDLGISGEGLLTVGAQLLYAQLFGLLVGGILWGVLGDRVGRIQALFGSILIYSLANIANGFVQSVEQYEILRFISGLGLAGEVGGAITLVGETLSKERRGVGTTIVAAAGAAGAACAGLLGDILAWRTMYFLGGALGLLLLGLRVAISESTTFQTVKKDTTVARGNLLLLFSNPSRVIRLLALISIGLPFIFAAQYLATFSPEIAAAILGGERITSSLPIILFSIGVTIGDVACGALSQALRSRKRAITIFLAGSVASFVGLMYLHGSDKTIFVAWYFPLGFFSGLWAVLITTSAELFGTNLRATAATMVPNLVRGVAIPIGWLFLQLKGASGIEMAVVATTSVVVVLALAGLLMIRESFTLSLEYVETKGGQASYSKTAMAACVASLAFFSTINLSAAESRSPVAQPSQSSRLKIGVSAPLTGVASSYASYSRSH
jgi:MFS family permease